MRGLSAEKKVSGKLVAGPFRTELSGQTGGVYIHAVW